MKASSFYLALTIHERINYRSGFDIAVAHESGTYNRFSTSIRCGATAKKMSQREYDIDRFYCSLRTRNKQC